MTNPKPAVPESAIAASLEFGLDFHLPYVARSINPDTGKIERHEDVVVTVENYRKVLLPVDIMKVEDRAAIIACHSDDKVTELEIQLTGAIAINKTTDELLKISHRDLAISDKRVVELEVEVKDHAIWAKSMLQDHNSKPYLILMADNAKLRKELAEAKGWKEYECCECREQITDKCDGPWELCDTCFRKPTLTLDVETVVDSLMDWAIHDIDCDQWVFALSGRFRDKESLARFVRANLTAAIGATPTAKPLDVEAVAKAIESLRQDDPSEITGDQGLAALFYNDAIDDALKALTAAIEQAKPAVKEGDDVHS